MIFRRLLRGAIVLSLSLLVAGCGITRVVSSVSSDSPDEPPATTTTAFSATTFPATTFSPESFATSAITPNATVAYVVDGDTIVVNVLGYQESVRLIGVNTPETVAESKPVQCYGKEASDFLSALLPSGSEVALMLDEEARDIYGRLLAYIFRDDGLFINHVLIAEGYAEELHYEPNDHFKPQLVKAQFDAVSANKGLWHHCGAPNVPLH